MSGPLLKLLSEIYERAEDECDIEIAFNSKEGLQENDCRDLLHDHLSKPNKRTGMKIADRLQRVTGNRSGIGLLFLICGFDRGHERLIVTRFPADQGVLADQRGGRLTIEFVERVFMRSAKAYKSVIYKTPSSGQKFWRGKAVDRQINGPGETSQYWVNEFLESSLVTLGATGSRRLAKAMRDATQKAPLAVRTEIVAGAQLLPNHNGYRATAMAVLKRVGLSDDAIDHVRRAMGRPELMQETFQLNAEEFRRHAPFRSVELDNGATLTADSAEFESIFLTRQVAEGRVEYSTEGQVIDDRLRAQR